ncbi:MAG: response regulator [Planctomycetaceae bacterium]|nr:response regulator [Planctomycetaceae bacterium]
MIRVLVVEDDPMVMDITCKYVESMPDFRVEAWAGNGEAAKTALAGGDIDLIILDIFMPGKSGLELLGNLRADGCLADVIFLTAAADTEAINRAQKLGFVDYLIKPFNYERFKTALVNYQKMWDLFHGNETATQAQLDSMLHPLVSSDSGRMSKGMHPKTLGTIRHYLEASPADAVVTQQELTEKLGLSRVTVRRYMEYLASIGEVTVQMVYGAVGRPSYAYQKVRL